ncbi:MAG: hypothetical protein ACRDOE_00850 [Streptosporangiaceae bacterium]
MASLVVSVWGVHDRTTKGSDAAGEKATARTGPPAELAGIDRWWGWVAVLGDAGVKALRFASVPAGRP